MSSGKLDRFPAALAGADLSEGAVTLLLDEALYPPEAIYGAAYVFIDRCYVLLDKPEAGRCRVTLAAKSDSSSSDALFALVGEFANELLSCAYRHQITQENRAVIESMTAQAIAGAMGPPSLDDLASFDFTKDALDDPLGIAMSWEDKYKSKNQKGGESDAKPAPEQKST